MMCEGILSSGLIGSHLQSKKKGSQQPFGPSTQEYPGEQPRNMCNVALWPFVPDNAVT